ncbi:hypothetical protein QH494_08840 [Sphingomonas sp. AR_OL41]|jgi:phage gp37-like protein|uniref:hypothetical protein n=1 Tax=Sphingomonas sp. AR_OL41 TaxID=3042729 RepID=UPI00248052DC|nr:hypothetical protein [Sphingomonas sp. AR_OL41]MDH7972287.1 hypothetical protein [Sphingomonas sp. AR_OL41]
MRHLLLLSVLLAASCSQQQPATKNETVPAASSLSTAPSPARTTSADALAAKRTAEQYFALIGAKKYAEARKIWDHDGADSGGDAAALAASYAVFATYLPTVGDPTEIKTVGSEQYVAVAVKVKVKEKRSGRTYEREGPVLMRRQMSSNGNVATAGPWHIWGVDIRRKH